MKGPDGVAERLNVRWDSALDNYQILAAPVAGHQLCIFKIAATANNFTPWELRDSVPVVYWNVNIYTGRNILDIDERGLFTLPEGQPLILGNVPLTRIFGNITYEIRPTGM